MHSNDDQEMAEPHSRARGWGADAGTDLPELPYIRLSQRARPPRRRGSLWMLLAAVLAGHALLAWLAFLVLRPAPQVELGTGIFTVTLIEPQSALPPPPPLLSPPPLPGQAQPSAPPRLVHREPPAPGAIRATLEGTSEPRLQLYDSSGRIRVPPAGAATAPTPAYRTPGLKGSEIYSGKSPLPYKPTPFEKDWAPPNQSLGAQTVGRAYEKAVEKTTVTKTVTLPGGIKVKCGVSPLLLALGCSPSPPPPPPDNDNDVRRSMPPPETLTGKQVVLPRSASTTARPSGMAQPASASTGP